MPRRNTLIFLGILLILVLVIFVGCLIERGIPWQKEVRPGLDVQGGTRIVYKADLSSVAPGEAGSAIDGAIMVLENRINPLGVTEPVIQKQGTDRILVELPGRSLTDKEIEGLSRVALLEFGELVTANETAKWENALGRWKPATGVIDGQGKALTSRYFKENTYVDRGNLGEIDLVFEWDKEGSQLSEQITSRLIGQPLGIFEGNEALLGEDGHPIAPIVMSTIVDSGRITGLSLKEATRSAKQLNAGRLPVPLQVVEVVRVPLK